MALELVVTGISLVESRLMIIDGSDLPFVGEYKMTDITFLARVLGAGNFRLHSESMLILSTSDIKPEVNKRWIVGSILGSN